MEHQGHHYPNFAQELNEHRQNTILPTWAFRLDQCNENIHANVSQQFWLREFF